MPRQSLLFAAMGELGISVSERPRGVLAGTRGHRNRGCFFILVTGFCACVCVLNETLETSLICQTDNLANHFIIIIIITCHLADAFIQSPLEQCGVKGLAQGPNSCADLIVATPEIEPPTLLVQVE